MTLGKFTLARFSQTAAIAVAVALSVPGATAHAQDRVKPQNVFEALFPRLIDERVRRERQSLQQFQQQQQQSVEQQRAQAAPIKKISGPQYYRYKVDKLVKIDLARLAVSPAVTTGAVETGVTDTRSAPDGNGASVVDSAPSAAEAAEQKVEELRQAAYERIASQFADLAVMAEPDVAKAIVSHYGETGRLIWLTGDLRPNAKARNALAVLADAGRHGLDPSAYAVELPPEDASAGEEARLAAAARFEISLTARALRYAFDAANGRIDPNRISGYHDFPKKKRDAAAELSKLENLRPSQVLLEAHPANAQFRALVAELEALERQSDDSIVIPEGTLIKPGETHEQVPAVIAAIGRKGSQELRDNFATILADSAPIQTSFTPEVVELVKAFQKEAGLSADGVVGRNTISRLSDLSVEAKRERVAMAMERLRWHPRDLGPRHVFINVPSYRARYVQQGVTQIDMRVVVGTRKNQTSFFHDVVETVEYNPYWGVPQSILVNEYLPKLRENPAYLDERGYEITDNRGNRIASSAVDWWSMSGSVPFNVRQSPGEANALGELKILFPNKHAIYMHDTPARNLFSRDERAFSHGCVRLAEPRKMAAAVLGKSEAHVEEMLKRGHGQDEVGQKFPVYVAYFTAWPKDDGTVEYFGDIYGRDEALRKAFEAVATERAPAA